MYFSAHFFTLEIVLSFFVHIYENELSWCLALCYISQFVTERLRFCIQVSQVSRILHYFLHKKCFFSCKLMGPPIEAIGASIEAVKLPWIQRKLPAFCNSCHWLPPIAIDFRLLPQSLHMLASATMSFRPYRRGSERAAHSLAKDKPRSRSVSVDLVV